MCAVYLAVQETKLRHACDVKSAVVGMIKSGEVVEALEERTAQSSLRIRTVFGLSLSLSLSLALSLSLTLSHSL